MTYRKNSGALCAVASLWFASASAATLPTQKTTMAVSPRIRSSVQQQALQTPAYFFHRHWPKGIQQAILERGSNGPWAIWGRGRALRNDARLHQIMCESREHPLTTNILREINRALDTLGELIYNTPLPPEQQERAAFLLRHLRQDQKMGQIRIFEPWVRTSMDFALVVASKDGVALARPFLEFIGFLPHNTAEMLFWAAAVRYGDLEDTFSTSFAKLVLKLFKGERHWSRTKLTHFPGEELTRQRLAQNAFTYSQKHPETPWMRMAHLVFLTDAETEAIFTAWYTSNQAWYFEHRLLNNLQNLRVFPDSLLKFVATREGDYVQFHIADHTHPGTLDIRSALYSLTDGSTLGPDEIALQNLPDLDDPDSLASLGADLVTIPKDTPSTDLARPLDPPRSAWHPVVVHRLARNGETRLSFTLPSPPALRPDPRAVYRGLYGHILQKDLHVIRPNLLVTNSGHSLYVEPQATPLLWQQDPDLTRQFFDFSDALARLWGGFQYTSAQSANPYQGSIYLWGVTEQHLRNVSDDDIWQEILKSSRYHLFVMDTLPLTFVTESRLSELIFSMAREGFQGWEFKALGTLNWTHDFFSTPLLDEAFQAARRIKKEWDLKSCIPLRAFIHQGRPLLVDPSDNKLNKSGLFKGFRFHARMLYLELRSHAGQLVHRQRLAKADVRLLEFPRVPEINPIGGLELSSHWPKAWDGLAKPGASTEYPVNEEAPAHPLLLAA